MNLIKYTKYLKKRQIPIELQTKIRFPKHYLFFERKAFDYKFKILIIANDVVRFNFIE